jgi:hypothetical protein
MLQTQTQQADELSTLQHSNVVTFLDTLEVSSDELSGVYDRKAQLQALREEAERLQKAGWATAINENTMEVERWRPRGSFPYQQEGYLQKLGKLVKTYLQH